MSTKPQPAYIAQHGSVLRADQSFYKALAETATDSTARKPTASFVLPIRSGRAWKLPAGSICRISTPEGPQVGDLNIWNLHNPRERFWAARTRQLHSSHVSVGDRLWSCLPYLRPLVTIIGDSLASYGVDEWGGRVHDLLGTRCDPYVNEMLTGGRYDFHCHSNLTRAVMPFGLTEFDVHDVVNVFQVTGLNENGNYFMRPCPAQKDDYFEFFAEIDCLCALSTCPGGDLSQWGWDEAGSDTKGDGPRRSMLDCCRPLKVEVFEIVDKSLLNSWESPKPSSYNGLHGIKSPVGMKLPPGMKLDIGEEHNR